MPRHGASSQPRAPGSSRPATPSGAGSSATCTTARSSAWWRSRSACGCASARSPPATPRPSSCSSQAKAELADALEELRELARGIHPAILTDRGLLPALETLAGRASIPVDVATTLEERLPASVEAAAYYIVAEAVTNASKHARASRVQVNVDHTNGRVLVEVADDGVGGADQRRGSGLRGLRDRVEALGGELALESPAGAGTTLTARLPVA